jgi:hypothetical protein
MILLRDPSVPLNTLVITKAAVRVLLSNGNNPESHKLSGQVPANASSLSEVFRAMRLDVCDGFNSGALSIERLEEVAGAVGSNSLCVFNGVSWPVEERERFSARE